MAMTKTYKSPTLKEDFLKLLSKKACNIKRTCEDLGIDRSTFYDWRDNDPEFRTLYDCTVEGLIDDVESYFMSNIQAKKETSIIFFLKTRAKHRGYVEKNEVDLGGKVEHTVTFMPKRDGVETD